jgi:hypothetical protein
MGMTFGNRFDEFHDAAIKNVGHSDFGDEDYQRGLRVLLESIDEGPTLDPGDKAVEERLVVSVLSSRLITQASWNTLPDATRSVITKPLIVIGVPRTGTTALHKLLSLDPQFQGIERWLIWGPMARPARHLWQTHPQYQATVTEIVQAHAAAPELMAAHSASADDVDECLTPMAQSFVSNFFPSSLDVESYDAWFRKQDERPSYRRFAAMLRLIGNSDERRWLLKNPSHLFGIDALLSTFPDACVVQTHRHPAQSIASLTNLLAGFRQLAGQGSANRQRIQRREIEFWAEATRRGMAAQDRAPERFVNVWQPELRDNPLGVVERIYGTFGITLTAETERRMLNWAAANPPLAHSPHNYRPLDQQGHLSTAFAPYLERYDL